MNQNAKRLKRDLGNKRKHMLKSRNQSKVLDDLFRSLTRNRIAEKKSKKVSNTCNSPSKILRFSIKSAFCELTFSLIKLVFVLK